MYFNIRTHMYAIKEEARWIWLRCHNANFIYRKNNNLTNIKTKQHIKMWILCGKMIDSICLRCVWRACMCVFVGFYAKCNVSHDFSLFRSLSLPPHRTNDHLITTPNNQMDWFLLLIRFYYIRNVGTFVSPLRPHLFCFCFFFTIIVFGSSCFFSAG